MLHFASRLLERATSPRRTLTRTWATLLLASAGLSGCDGNSPTASPYAMAHPLRFAITSSLTAGEGAVVEVIVTYQRPSGTTVTIARDTAVIGASGTGLTLPVTADVAACVDDAQASNTTCKVTLTMRLKRDGRLLDESIQQFDVTASTQSVTVPTINLYEVSTVNVTPATLTNVEPGDTQALTASAVDRSGNVIAGRAIAWSVVSGNVTVSATGALTAVGAGDARVRATIGGRTGDLAFTVGPASVATLAIVPADTLVTVGGAVTYTATGRSSTGAIVPLTALTLTSSNPGVATVSSLTATAVGVGTTTITARTTQGRGGATVTTTATLRVEAVPPILVDRTTVVLDSLAPGTTGSVATVALTTTPGKTIRNLQAAVTYTPNVTPWLNAVISTPTTTPTTLGLQAVSGALAPGDYAADVRITSSTDVHVPATVRVTLRVVAGRRVVLNPKTVNLGSYDPTVTTGSPVVVAVNSSTSGAIADRKSVV